MSVGIQSQISFKKETTWGTAVVPDKSIAVRPTGGIDIKEDIQEIPAIKGQLQKVYDTIKGKVSYGGEFTMDTFGDYVGNFLLSAFGTDTPTTHSGETVVYDHVFTESNPKPSFTIEQAQGENVRRFAGAIVSAFKLSGKVGEMIQFSTSFMAKTQAAASQITGAFTTIPSFNHSQVVVKIGGASIGEVESFELNYKNGLELVYALGNLEPSYASISGGSEVSGKLDLYLDSTTLAELNNYISKTNRSIEIIITGTATIGTAAHYALDITIPNAVYKTAATKITDSHNLLSIEFTGVYDAGGTNKLIACTLTNLITTY